MIAIPNMEKPKNCRTCTFKSNKEGECWYVHDENDCSLIDIVQCKDCRYNDGTDFCEFYYMSIFPKDFCSYGERRADGDI